MSPPTAAHFSGVSGSWSLTLVRLEEPKLGLGAEGERGQLRLKGTSSLGQTMNTSGSRP